MNIPAKTQVVIIGAGLTGLTLGFYLKKAGVNFIIIEKSGSTGGVIKTNNENGFVFETGPNTGVISHPEMAELFEHLDKSKCIIETADPSAERRLIWKNYKWHAIPSGLVSAITTPLFTFYDKFRILGEPFRKKGTNPNESLADLVRRRLGKSFLDYAIDPFISGIYAGDPEKLITRFALPKLWQLEQDYGSFIKGAIKKHKLPKDDRTKKATKKVFTAKGGLSNLINALTEEIGKENIILSCIDTLIKPNNNLYQIQLTTNDQIRSIEASKIVTTTGGYTLESLLPFLSKDELSPFNELKYAAVTQVLLGFNKWEGMSLNAFGGLVPGKEKRKILGVLFTSSFFSNRAPKGGALLSIFMGGIRKPEYATLNDQQIRNLLDAELPEMLGLESLNPDLIKIVHYPKAIPQYEISSGIRFDMIKKIMKKYDGLYLAGNIRDGIGMADRVKQARTIAEELIANFKESEQ